MKFSCENKYTDVHAVFLQHTQTQDPRHVKNQLICTPLAQNTWVIPYYFSFITSLFLLITLKIKIKTITHSLNALST